MAVYAIADTHFGHRNVLKWRTDFSSIEDHDNTIYQMIRLTCGKRDSLYILGDVALGPDSLKYIEAIAREVEFLHIVLGNHDDERKGSPTVRDYLSVCRNVYGLRKYKGAWLSHAPLHPDELRGKVNIHGHVHGRCVEGDDRYVNVSCENTDYTPINMVDIFEGWR